MNRNSWNLNWSPSQMQGHYMHEGLIFFLFMGLYSGELSSNDLWWEVCQLIFLGHCLNVDTIPPQYPGTKSATGQVHKILFSWSLLSLLFCSLVRWNCDNLPYCNFLFFFFLSQMVTQSQNVRGKKTWTPTPCPPTTMKMKSYSILFM